MPAIIYHMQLSVYGGEDSWTIAIGSTQGVLEEKQFKGSFEEARLEGLKILKKCVNQEIKRFEEEKNNG